MPTGEQTSTTGTPTAPMASPHGDISRVQVKIPPFWAADPEMWFAQIESQFDIAKVTTEETKFGYVAGNLEARYATEVRDILTNPPTQGKYTKLKTELIRRLSATQEQKTRRLLEQEVLGDRKPSQFLRYLQGLAGSAVPENLLRSIWVSRLPTHIQAILTTQKTATLDAIADLADAIMEASPSFQVSVASAPPAPASTMDALVQQFSSAMATVAAELRKEIAAVASLQTQTHRRDRSRSRTRSRSSNRGECWFHQNYGVRARKCRSPCTYKATENGQGSR